MFFMLTDLYRFISSIVIVREGVAVEKYSFKRPIPGYLQKVTEPLDINVCFEFSGRVAHRCAWGGGKVVFQMLLLKRKEETK